MAIKSFKPYTPSRRNMTVSAFEGVDKQAKPERSLVEPIKKCSGRNNHGKITVRHRGGANKRKYRIIDFKRDKVDMPGIVQRLEYSVQGCNKEVPLRQEDSICGLEFTIF